MSSERQGGLFSGFYDIDIDIYDIDMGISCIDHTNCVSVSETHLPPFHVLYWATTQEVFFRAGFSLCSTCT